MRLPRLRYSLRLRTLIILVALAASGLGFMRWMDRRASQFRRVAMDYRDMAKLDEIQAAIEVLQAGGAGPDSSVEHLPRSRRGAVIGAYPPVLPREDEYTPAHPWLPLRPDP